MERVRALLSRDEPVVWLFAGDSVTAGGRHTAGGRSFGELFNERVRCELGRSRDVVVNTAVGGWQVTDVAGDFERSVARFAPDVVFIGLGLNDSRHEEAGVPAFRTAYGDLCRRITDTGAIPVPQTSNTGVVTAAPFVRAHLSSYVAAVREVAAEQGLPLVDHHSVWSAAEETGTLPEQWMSEGCHPNAHGHRVMAHTIFEALGIMDPASPTCRLFAPR